MEYQQHSDLLKTLFKRFDPDLDFKDVMSGGHGAPLSDQEKEQLYALGYSLYNQGRYVDAMKAFWTLLCHDISDPRHYMGMAACQQMLNLHKKAIESYGLAWVMNVDNPVPLFHMAQCLVEENMIEEAKEVLDGLVSASEGMPEHAELRKRAIAILAKISSKSTLS
jgi:type III secretion system low calcium response chaperone LcrH/SycD